MGYMQDLQEFSIELASKYGVEQAVLIGFLHKIMQGGNSFNQKLVNGKVWMHLPFYELEARLRFWNEQRIRRIIQSLVYHKVLSKKRIPELGFGLSYSFR